MGRAGGAHGAPPTTRLLNPIDDLLVEHEAQGVEPLGEGNSVGDRCVVDDPPSMKRHAVNHHRLEDRRDGRAGHDGADGVTRRQHVASGQYLDRLHMERRPAKAKGRRTGSVGKTVECRIEAQMRSSSPTSTPG